jgi:hypothetical protein
MNNLTQYPAPSVPTSITANSALILLGRDEAGKAHASRFDDLDLKAVRNAAAIMGMATLPIVGKELATMAVTLPKGKLYESGRAFVPFVKSDLYERLHDQLPKKGREALAETNALRRAAAEAAKAADAEPETFTLPDDWAKITVGNLVLAYDGEGEAWFEAYVVETKSADDLVLRWRGWPDLPNFVRTRNRIALMHPAYPINTAC